MTTSRRSQAAPREHKVESQTKRDSVLKALRNSRGCDAAGIFLSANRVADEDGISRDVDEAGAGLDVPVGWLG